MCERCRRREKRLREMTELTAVDIRINAGTRRGERETWALCQACTMDLMNWLYGGGKEETEDAVRDVPEDYPADGRIMPDGGTDGAP